jgi:hypothetical protein
MLKVVGENEEKRVVKASGYVFSVLKIKIFLENVCRYKY